MTSFREYLAPSVYAVRLSAEERNRIEAAARRAKMPLSDWARRALRERALVEAGIPLAEGEPDPKRREWLATKHLAEQITQAAIDGASVDKLVEMALPLRKLHPMIPAIARFAAQLGRARRNAENFHSERHARIARDTELILQRMVNVAREATAARAAYLVRQAHPDSLPQTHIPDIDPSSSELPIDVGLALGQIQTQG